MNAQGLVHRTQMSKCIVDDATEILQQGEKVWCKAIKLTDDGKLSLSMKVVNQGTGADLDPNGVQIHQDEQRRMSRPPPGGRKKIELGAVLNINCSKCGTRGHLGKDCFQDPSGKTYDLIPDEDEPPEQSLPTKLLEEVKKKSKKSKEKKEKTEKKKKKKKKRKRSTSTSSNSSTSSEDTRKRKKAKKSRKRSPSQRK
ncbi:nucleolar protein of 40 kDa-like isoform X2 [Cimex lectularius]|nr:nucleolar protein of 40 kDa-like isoform X2 [Cimex lectularius]